MQNSEEARTAKKGPPSSENRHEAGQSVRLSLACMIPSGSRQGPCSMVTDPRDDYEVSGLGGSLAAGPHIQTSVIPPLVAERRTSSYEPITYRSHPLWLSVYGDCIPLCE
jgi:hypothetical protein